MAVRLLQILRRAEEGFIFLLLAAMVMLAGTQILLRNLWESGIAWGDPVLRVLVLWVGMLGAMIASRSNQHISIDILSHYLSPKWKIYSSALTNLFSAVICALLSWHSGRFVIFEWQDGAELFPGIPVWIAEAILPVGFAVIAVRFAVLSVQSVMSSKT
jgi:TRAP-type C4-dicarboxylate transport system permease small subunit